MKTWDDNRQTINQLWPMMEFTAEEKRLWHDDLSGLDQVVLYDALRNVKRTRDSMYPQLAWVHAAYRELNAAKKAALKPLASKLEQREGLPDISDEEDKRLGQEFVTLIDDAGPNDFGMIEKMVLDSLPKMHAPTAHKVLMYAKKRLLGQEAIFGRVTSDGDIQPIRFGGSA